MAHYKFADVLEEKGDENVLDNSHACGDLHRTRNQRLLAGRVLNPRNAVEASPSAYRAGGLGLSVCLRPATGHDAKVIGIDFSVGSIKPFPKSG